MLADFVDITILLDASSSMHATANKTKAALLKFIGEQQAEPGIANLTLVEFSDPMHFNYKAMNTPIRLFNTEGFGYVPFGGSTALRAAWLKLIQERGAYFASLPAASRPNKVVFVVITDGIDNASFFVTRGQILEAVRHQEQTYKWEFIYLGANQDAVTEAADYGVAMHKAMTYSADFIGSTASSLSNTVSTYRSTGTFVGFDSIDRNKAEGK